MKNFLALLLLLSFQTSFAQFSWNAELNLQGMASRKKEELPFWMHHNQRGRFEKETNLAGWLSGKTFYDLGKKGFFEAGAGLMVRDANSDRVFTDELYLNYTINWFEVTFGRKQQEEFYNGLSASNRSILWSLNTRPLPGIQLKTNRPVFITRNFGFEATWEEYLMDGNRFIDKTRLHHKSFDLVYSTTDRSFELKAGIQHFAQWGGNSRVLGKQPDGFSDYLRIFTGQGGSSDAVEGDRQNALGNHIGGYELFIKKTFPKIELEFFYNHLFEDGSGSQLGNTPDGRYGIFVDFNEKQWISSLVYEFYYTKHQSHSTSGAHISDDYFNNGVYRSGWTYHDQVIGSPFFITNYYDDNYSEGFVQIGSNIFTAHHLGISGIALTKFPYKFKSSYRRNYGRNKIADGFQNVDHFSVDDPRGRFIIPSEVLSSYLDIEVLKSPIIINVIMGTDFSNLGLTGGASLHAVYRIE